MYGPVRTVVWQGSAGDRRPYADQCYRLEQVVARLKELGQEATTAPALEPVVGARVAVGGLGLEGTIVAI